MNRFANTEFDTIEDVIINAQSESAHPSVINRTPIAGAHSYYRSRIITTRTGVNPLIAAAEAVISLNNHLKNICVSNYDLKKLAELQKTLTHEINSFETNAMNRGFRAETILIARYILCATLDETLLGKYWPDELSWQPYRLLNTFQQEDASDERFFLILSRISEDPIQHIELLELIYICLRLGFVGQFHQQPQSKEELDKIIDNLYQCIRRHRPEPALLFSDCLTVASRTHKAPSTLSSMIIQSTLICLFLIAIIYFGFTYLSERITYPLQQQMQQVINMPAAKKHNSAT